MSAVALQAPVGTVMNLTGRRLDKVQRELNRTDCSSWINGWMLSIFQKFIAYNLRRWSIQYTDDAIWFKGVAKEAWDNNIDSTNSLKSLLPRLERIKSDTQSVREKLLLLRNRETTTATLSIAIDDFLASSADLFESIENFRWTLLELQANHSEIREGFSACTPENIDDLFSRLKQEV